MEKWSRRKMKEIGKSRMKSNYWKSVLVAALFVVFTGVFGTAMGSSSESSTETISQTTQLSESVSEEYNVDNQNVWGEYHQKTQRNIGLIIVVSALLFGIALVFVIDIFILKPFAVGCDRFFYQNLEKDAQVKEICYAYDRNYKNVVKAMFFHDLYIFLWSLLFIVPGVIKSYEYSMMPYLLAEHEHMTKEEAFAESKRLMDGNKWRAFVLNLSFIPWIMLSVLTFGIVGVFYVQPYMGSTAAAFYQAVKEEKMFEDRAVCVDDGIEMKEV